MSNVVVKNMKNGEKNNSNKETISTHTHAEHWVKSQLVTPRKLLWSKEIGTQYLVFFFLVSNSPGYVRYARRKVKQKVVEIKKREKNSNSRHILEKITLKMREKNGRNYWKLRTEEGNTKKDSPGTHLKTFAVWHWRTSSQELVPWILMDLLLTSSNNMMDWKIKETSN